LATFEEQVEGLTGLTIGSSPAPSTAELTQFLRDGALNVTDKWIIGHPEDKESFQRESSPIENNGDFDLKGADIISVMRENETDGSSDGSTAWRPCRKIPPSLQSQVVDTESLSFASKYHPVYTIIDFNEVHVYPTPDGTNDSFKVFYINHVPKDLTNSADLAYNHSDIKYFPANKVYLVALYASVQSLQTAMSNSVVSLSISSPTTPVLKPISFTSDDLTFNESVPSAIAASVLNSPGISSISKADISGDVPTYTKPAPVPSAAFSSFTSGLSELDPGVFSITAVVPATPAAPSFTTPAVESFGSAPSFVPPSTSQVTTYIETNQDVELASAKLQEVNTNMQAALNIFNEKNVAYQAKIQENIQEVNLLLQKENQEYAAKLQKYSAEVNTYQADVGKQVQEYQSKLSQYTSELGVSVQAWQQEESNKVAQYQADIQNELNEFNKENARYQANIQAEITKVQIDSQEAQKEGDMTLQADITEYANNLQKYQADVARYSASVSADVQQFQQDLASEVQSWQADVQDNTGVISKYQAELADYQAEVAKELQENTAKVQQYQLLYNQLKQQYNEAFVGRTPQQAPQQQARRR